VDDRCSGGSRRWRELLAQTASQLLMLHRVGIDI
jgi:hypothetical protein